MYPTENELIRTLESFLRYTNSEFGRRAAGGALKRLQGGFAVHALSREEIQSLREHRRWQKDFPKLQRIWPETLPAMEKACPYCHKRIWGNARIVRVLKETADLDLVSVICRCGTLFRKYELKRDEL